MRLFVGGSRSVRAQRSVFKAIKSAGLTKDDIEEIVYGSDIGVDWGAKSYCRQNRVQGDQYDDKAYELYSDAWWAYMYAVIEDCDFCILVYNENCEKFPELDKVVRYLSKPVHYFNVNKENPWHKPGYVKPNKR